MKYAYFNSMTNAFLSHIFTLYHLLDTYNFCTNKFDMDSTQRPGYTLVRYTRYHDLVMTISIIFETHCRWLL